MNMLATIVPKSDQLNSDDLIGQDRTITITHVTMDTSSEQPVSLHFEGDNSKPYKPGKSMRRVLVQAWGPDASAYDGRSLTLYRDPDVKFGGMDVGGIRISSMSHITKRLVLALTATRGNKKLFTVEVLKVPAPSAKPAPADPAFAYVDKLIGQLSVAPSLPDMDALLADPARVKRLDELRVKRPSLAADVDAAVDAARERLRPMPMANTVAQDGMDDSEVPF